MNLKELPDSINGVLVIKDLGMNNQTPKKRIAEFKCNCGNTFIARVNSVKVGHRKSCGCLVIAPSTFTHRLSNHPLYRKWSGMITRVTNKKEKKWDRYGGRGITICDEWRNSFITFYNWAIENGWENGLSIDRINNDGNYEPLNCQWITISENSTKDQIKFNPSEKQKNAICEMYLDRHITITYLSKMFHTHKERISSILKEKNIEIKHRRMRR